MSVAIDIHSKGELPAVCMSRYYCAHVHAWTRPPVVSELIDKMVNKAKKSCC